MSSAAPEEAADGMRYAAFISYSHRDRTWAEWLHRALETYRVPDGLAAAGNSTTARPALYPIFLDRAELPSSSSLAGAVQEALAQSRFLIVVCSPDAARSRWVNEEIRAFRALGRGAQILCLVVAGEPDALTAASGEDCFPPALRESLLAVDGATLTAIEPLAADVRPGKDSRRRARLKIAAGLLRVPLDALVQRDHVRRHRRLLAIAVSASIAALAFAALAVTAMFARSEAEEQRARAVQQSQTARRTADFLKSLFVVSNPTEARGNSITAREVLDRGARQIDAQLRNEPQVRAELSTTLGEVYTGLGLLNESRRLLAGAASVPRQPLEAAARQRLALADVEYLRDDYDAALAQLHTADQVIASAGADGEPLRPRLWMAYGDVYLRLDDAPRARDYFERALKLTALPGADDPQLAAGALQGIAQLDVGAENFVAAETRLLEALRLQISATGELHPRTSEILNELGSLEYMRQRTKAAAGYFRRVIAIDRRVLGEHHPDLAITLNNLARVELEQRHFTAARDSLREAVAMRAGETLATGELMTFLYGNLGLAYLGLGDYAAARAPLEQGLQAAVINRHRMHGPILADLGDLDCRTGHYREGLEKLADARPLMAASYPDDPWRTALIDSIRGSCLLGLRRSVEAQPLLARSAPVLLARWGPESLYGHDVVRRTADFARVTGKPLKFTQDEAHATGN